MGSSKRGSRKSNASQASSVSQEDLSRRVIDNVRFSSDLGITRIGDATRMESGWRGCTDLALKLLRKLLMKRPATVILSYNPVINCFAAAGSSEEVDPAKVGTPPIT